MPWLILTVLLACLAFVTNEYIIPSWRKEAGPTVKGNSSFLGMRFSMDELEAKAKEADTREKLEAALGKPDIINTRDSMEAWSYYANDGHITFLFGKNFAGAAIAKSSSK